MKRHCRLLSRLPIVLVMLSAWLVGPTADAQDQSPIAPLTHDNHEHKYNPAHPTIPAGPERFFTNRKGAKLVLPVEEDAFTFVVFGDRTGGPKEGVNILAQAVADTNLIEPDLVMTVGDLIEGYNTTDQWMPQMTQFKEIMGELICPWFPVAGNHDIYWRGDNKPEGEHEKSYEMHFGPLWYAFEHKNCFFIALYSDESNPQTGEKNFNKPDSQRMSEDQFNWLKSMLDKAKDADHVFLFLHHPRWLGRNYGEDWDKVHKELVKAGNVSAVFAGHIHHMRYDPKDGIEYFSLATVGGHQPSWSPAAGFLHQFNIVTVRKNQIAHSVVPVGGVMDPKAITGDVSEQAERLARHSPVKFKAPIGFKDDGSVADEITFTVKNPAIFAIEIDALPTSDDSRWGIAPDHQHVKIEPGKEATLTFKVTRQAGDLDTTLRGIVLELGIDMLTDRNRFAIPVKRITVPGSVKVQAE